MASWSKAAARHGLPKRMRDVVGMTVVTTRAMSNGYMEIPAGTSAVVTSASDWTRVRIRGAPCACCGIAANMTVDAFSLRPEKPEEVAGGSGAP